MYRGGVSGSAAQRGGAGPGGAKGSDLAGVTPVIIVPNVLSSLITLYNAKEFLQDGRREVEFPFVWGSGAGR